MGKIILIVIVIMLLAVGMGTIAYTLFTSVVVVPRISNTTKSMNDYPGYAPNIRIGRVYYHTSYNNNTGNISKSICNTTIKKQIIIMEAIFSTQKMPESCEILVDNRFEKRIKLYDLPCEDGCDDQELKLAIDISEQNLFAEHVLQLCCGSICLKHQIPAECT